jgi:exodeoxyribonuclease VII small subunit
VYFLISPNKSDYLKNTLEVSQYLIKLSAAQKIQMIISKVLKGTLATKNLRHTFTMAKKTFEAALARLEQITNDLEDGDLSLENSLKKFDEGIKLADFCNQKLTEAKSKVEILLNKDGETKAVPFEETESGNKELSE